MKQVRNERGKKRKGACAREQKVSLEGVQLKVGCEKKHGHS